MKKQFAQTISAMFRHPTDINEPLTGMEITGMTFAGTMLSVLQVVINVFIAYYYTNVIGISAAFVGTLLLVTRIADAFSDLGMGVIITKTRSRMGRARPWAIRMALPLLIMVILSFCVPEQWNMTAKTIYACITYFLMITVAVTPAGIVGSVLGTAMTSNANSRQKSAVFGTLFVMLGSVAGTFATQQITEALGDTYAAWRGVAVGFALLAFIGQVVQFLLTKERDTEHTADGKECKRLSIKESLPAILKNRYFMIMCMIGVFGSIDAAMSGCTLYYLKYVLNNTGLVGIVSIVTLAATMIGIALVPIAAKKIPPKTLMLIGMAVKIITFPINILFPANLPLFIGFSALRMFVGAPMMIYSGVYFLNTIEYGEYKTGIRANSLIVTVSSVAGKVGSGFGGALIGWLLAASGYIGTAATQPLPAQQMIVYIYFLIPMVVAVAQFGLLSRYDLDKKYDHIVQTLKERKEGREVFKEAA